METDTKKQRQHFYRDSVSGQWSMSELCDRYQISRPTGYKWIDRLETEGLKAVDDRSRAPNRHPNRTPEPVERWRHEYNTFRLHRALGYWPPAPEAVEPKTALGVR